MGNLSLAVAFAAVFAAPCAAAPRLLVTPVQSLIDAPITITVDGLNPDQEFVVRGVSRLDAQTALISRVRARADAAGKANLESASELLWAMSPEPLAGRAGDELGRAFTPLQAFDVVLELETDGGVVVTAKISRLFVAETVTVTEVREHGLLGRLYMPASRKRVAALITLGGSEGGIESAAFRAMLLASHGYAALAIAYFKADGLPQTLAAIPLETIEHACEYLRKRGDIDAARIGIVGSSRGAEMALLAASAFPALHAVVGYAPNNYALAAIVGGPQQSAWTLKGIAVPFVPTPPDELVAGLKAMPSGHVSVGPDGCLRRAPERPRNEPDGQ